MRVTFLELSIPNLACVLFLKCTKPWNIGHYPKVPNLEFRLVAPYMFRTAESFELPIVIELYKISFTFCHRTVTGQHESGLSQAPCRKIAQRKIENLHLPLFN